MGRVKRTRALEAPLQDPAEHPPESMGRLMAEYLQWCRVRNYSKQTVMTRGQVLDYFRQWAADRGLFTPGEVSREALEAYQRWMWQYRMKNGKALSMRTQAQRVVALRCFFQWCMKARRISANPASEMETPRLPPRLPRDVLRPEEMESVLARVNSTSVTGLRDRAMLEVFYSTGMRRMEIAGLSISDVELARGVVRIRHGKGGKDRLVPIGDRACSWVERYLNESRPALVKPPDCGLLFLSNEGDAFDLRHISDNVRRIIKRSEVGKKGGCHLLRHTMATLMLENGADIRALQEMLGHASMDTTAIYTHLSITHLQKVHARTHPADLPKPARLAVDLEDESTQEGAQTPAHAPEAAPEEHQETPPKTSAPKPSAVAAA